MPEPSKMAMSQLWHNSQPYYASNPATGETVQWDKKSAFTKDALSQGFTPQEVEKFVKESRL